MAKRGIQSMKISVVGAGVVGLPLALLLAKSGHKVMAVDVDKNLVDSINNGVLPSKIKEPELEELMKDNAVKANLTAGLSPKESDIFVVAVPTPVKEDKEPDLGYVEAAVESTLPVLKEGNLIIIESTIPPKTCTDIVKTTIEGNTKLRVGQNVYLAHCPERILPGDIYKEIVNNDRIVGGFDKKSAELARDMYASFVKGNLYLTDCTTAEFCKLVENAFRDVNIAFANELSLVADDLGININEVIELANKHPRVSILKPGIGVGGHCIPIDPWFIYDAAPKKARLIKTAREVNDSMPQVTADKIKEFVSGIEKPRIIILGLTYKPDIADLRESPAVRVVEILKGEGYNVSAYDPLIPEKSYKSLDGVCKDADCVVVLVQHKIIKDQLAGFTPKKLLVF
ncbi:MAG: nucleotide sugar dehydrogenase [Candidatus Altiarchaeota archaeon]|nr:nucleotide sugar dehydrogenase [Candidatus Altiarchaeota archaeon]